MSIFESAIGWLAPPQCMACGLEGSALCISCLTTEITAFGDRCWRCLTLSQNGRTCSHCQHVGGPRAVWISTDYKGLAQNIVRQYKFGQLRAAAEPLAESMTRTLLSFLSAETIRAQNYLLVPVPTATSRVRQRGFDHSSLLAKRLARKLGLRYYPALRRLGQARQLGAPRTQRLAHSAGNYLVTQTSLLAGRNILLVDDVVTTGATLIAATQALHKSGVHHVDALVFAKKL